MLSIRTPYPGSHFSCISSQFSGSPASSSSFVSSASTMYSPASSGPYLYPHAAFVYPIHSAPLNDTDTTNIHRLRNEMQGYVLGSDAGPMRPQVCRFSSRLDNYGNVFFLANTTQLATMVQRRRRERADAARARAGEAGLIHSRTERTPDDIGGARFYRVSYNSDNQPVSQQAKMDDGQPVSPRAIPSGVEMDCFERAARPGATMEKVVEELYVRRGATRQTRRPRSVVFRKLSYGAVHQAATQAARSDDGLPVSPGTVPSRFQMSASECTAVGMAKQDRFVTACDLNPNQGRVSRKTTDLEAQKPRRPGGRWPRLDADFHAVLNLKALFTRR